MPTFSYVTFTSFAINEPLAFLRAENLSVPFLSLCLLLHWPLRVSRNTVLKVVEVEKTCNHCVQLVLFLIMKKKWKETRSLRREERIYFMQQILIIRHLTCIPVPDMEDKEVNKMSCGVLLMREESKPTVTVPWLTGSYALTNPLWIDTCKLKMHLPCLTHLTSQSATQCCVLSWPCGWPDIAARCCCPALWPSTQLNIARPEGGPTKFKIQSTDFTEWVSLSCHHNVKTW